MSRSRRVTVRRGRRMTERGNIVRQGVRGSWGKGRGVGRVMEGSVDSLSAEAWCSFML